MLLQAWPAPSLPQTHCCPFTDTTHTASIPTPNLANTSKAATSDLIPLQWSPKIYIELHRCYWLSTICETNLISVFCADLRWIWNSTMSVSLCYLWRQPDFSFLFDLNWVFGFFFWRRPNQCFFFSLSQWHQPHPRFLSVISVYLVFSLERPTIPSFSMWHQPIHPFSLCIINLSLCFLSVISTYSSVFSVTSTYPSIFSKTSTYSSIISDINPSFHFLSVAPIRSSFSKYNTKTKMNPSPSFFHQLESVRVLYHVCFCIYIVTLCMICIYSYVVFL